MNTNHTSKNIVKHLFALALPSGAAGCSDGAQEGSPLAEVTQGSTTVAASSAQAPSLIWKTTAPGEINVIRFSPDGTLVASGGDGASTKVWRATDGKMVTDLGRRSGGAEDLAFSPDGALLAVGNGGGPDLNLHVYNLANGFLPFGRLEGHRNGTRGVAYTPDGRFLITGGGKGSTKVWRASDMALLQTFDDGRTNINSVSISPDGALIASGANSGAVHLWRLASGAQIGTLKSPLPPYPNNTLAESSVTFSPQGRLLAAQSKDGITLWDVVTLQPVRQLSHAPANVVSDTPESIAFSPDGQTLVSSLGYWQYPGMNAAPRAASIRFWRVADGALVKEYDLGTAPTVHVAFAPSGKRFAYGLFDGTLAVAETPF